MSPKQVRPVATAALYNTSRHALGICRRVCNTCRYVIRRSNVGAQSLETAIENALANVVMQHGILRVGVGGEDTTEPFFSFVEKIDLRDMITWKRLEDSEEALLRSLEQIHDKLWAGLAHRPGWQIIVHHTDAVDRAENVTLDITFAFHHAYADGTASKLFHRDLLKALNDANSSPLEMRDHVLHLDIPPELLPGMETIVPLRISWSYLLKTIWSEIIWQDLVPDWFKTRPSPESIPWTGREVSIEPHHVNIRRLDIPQSTLAAVLRACREHKTTLTPLIHVLIAASLSRRLSAESAPAFSTVTPIDLRRYAKAEYDVQNNFAALVSSHDDVFDAKTLSRLRSSQEKSEQTDALIWQTALALSSRLRSKVDSLPNDDITGMMSWVSDWQKFWTDKFGKKRAATWEVSNIGSLSAAETKGAGGKGWCITSSMMTQGALPAGSAFSVNVAGVEGGGICASLTWQETVVDAELLQGLAEDLKDMLKDLRNHSGFGIDDGH